MATTALREISHLIGDTSASGVGTRTSDIFEPYTGAVQSSVRLHLDMREVAAPLEQHSREPTR